MSAPVARVVHSIPGRVRLRTQGIKGDLAAFEQLRTAFEETRGVKNVQVNPATGSVLVEYEGNLEDVLRELEQSGGLSRFDEPPQPYLAHVNRALIESDQRLKQASSGKVDLELVAFFGFLAGGVYQVFNNHALPAGVTLLRYAVELVTSTAIQQVRESAAKLPPSDSGPSV